MKKAILVIALVLVGGLVAVKPTQACFLGFGDDCSTFKPQVSTNKKEKIFHLSIFKLKFVNDCGFLAIKF